MTTLLSSSNPLLEMAMIAIGLCSDCRLETFALFGAHAAGGGKEGRTPAFLGFRIQRMHVAGDINEHGIRKFVEIP